MSDTVLSEVLSWSRELQLWHRDILRRLLSEDVISGSEVSELVSLNKKENGISAHGAGDLTSVPVSSEHIPLIDGKQAVSIQKVSNIMNANALAEGQELIFNPSGINVLYGGNGTGKSGYSRIFKRSCRTRSRGEQILHNVYKENPGVPASADIKFLLGPTEKTISWKDAREGIQELYSVSVFDSDSAVVHVSEANNVAFTPLGLDLLPRLADTMKKVQSVIKSELREIEQKAPSFSRSLIIKEDTSGYKFLSNLTADTKESDIDEAGAWSEENINREKEVLVSLSKDLLKEVREVEHLKDDLKKLRAFLTTLSENFNKSSIEEVKSLFESYVAAEKVAKLAAADIFSDEPFPTYIADSAWRDLWESARKYSEAYCYANVGFPNTENEARCVLCQQPLGKEGADRLNRFEKFVKDDTALQSKKARALFNDHANKIIGTHFDFVNNVTGYSHLKSINPELAFEVKKTIITSRINKRYTQVLLNTGVDLGSVEPCLLDVSKINFEIQKLDSKIVELKKLATSEGRKKLERELEELASVKWVSQNKSEISEEVNRLRYIELLKLCIKKCDTRGVTSKSTELTHKYLTDTIKEQFVSELNFLGFKAVNITIEPKSGSYGSMSFQITLSDSSEGINCGRVLSEGEQKCIALAGFLSELATAPSDSALVFDDPVSSLDHKWRRRVAERLVEEAKKRQVIILTHDIVFFHLLEDISGESVNFTCSHLDRLRDKTGICKPDVPWDAMNIRKRISFLNVLAQDAERRYNESTLEDYKMSAEYIYKKLREAWERAIEEVLLNKTVVRFGRKIETQRLKKIIDVTQEDIDLVDGEMSKCSLYAHDQPGAALEDPPAPDELRRDIKKLGDWVSELRKQRGRN